MNKVNIGYVLAVLAIFTGIIPHNKYCEMLSNITPNCPNTKIVALFSIVLFAIAILMCQYEQLAQILPSSVNSILAQI